MSSQKISGWLLSGDVISFRSTCTTIKQRELSPNVTNHGIALTLVMRLEIVESWKEPGEQISKTKTNGQPSISSERLLKSSSIKEKGILSSIIPKESF